jgi:hypothetical protein
MSPLLVCYQGTLRLLIALRADEGLATLAKLHAAGDIHDPWVRAEFAQIQEAITDEHEHEAKSYFELFKNK